MITKNKKDKKRILIIENDQALACLCGQRLTNEGYEVRWVRDGLHGVNTVLAFEPHLILLATHLPNRGGLGILRIMRSLPETRSLPVIILASSTKAEYFEAATRYGISGFYHKTDLLPEDLSIIVAQALKTIGLNQKGIGVLT